MYDMRKPGTPTATRRVPPARPAHRAAPPRTTVRPRLSGTISASWFAKESLTFLAPDGRANVIVSSEPLDPTIDTALYAQVQGDLLRQEFPRYRELAFEPAVVLGGLAGFVRVFAWCPPDGIEVTQVQVYATEPGRGFTATATTPSTDYPGLRDELWTVITGLRVTA